MPSIYLPLVRSHVPQFLTVFDFPEPSEVRGRRDVTTVATQALLLMNHPWVQQQARAAAERLLSDSSQDGSRIQWAYLATVGRRPTPEQAVRSLDYIQQRILAAGDQPPRQAAVAAWAELFHALFASSEFRYRG